MFDGPPASRGSKLDQALRDLMAALPELQAAAVVSFDGLPMCSVLPADMNEDRVAAMSAALLSLGEKASVGLGRGELSQVFIEGESGTVFLVSCESEAVLVAVANSGAKKGLVLYEVRRTAATVGAVLRDVPESDVEDGWRNETAVESDVFAQALADAEAAYQAHRAESQWVPEPALTDVNVVYTPTNVIPTLEPPLPITPAPEVDAGLSWYEENARRWDVR